VDEMGTVFLFFPIDHLSPNCQCFPHRLVYSMEARKSFDTESSETSESLMVA
jgi:hypothetical protein